MSHQTLFLQQSYLDCTEQYESILKNPNIPLWDYVVLTASNEAQAEAYQAQMQLPKRPFPYLETWLLFYATPHLHLCAASLHATLFRGLQ